jgi:hypothetical protein
MISSYLSQADCKYIPIPFADRFGDFQGCPERGIEKTWADTEHIARAGVTRSQVAVQLCKYESPSIDLPEASRR